MSKKLILTVITLFAFVITNAQEKANHHTTRSNQTSGIMAKETGDNVDDDCDAVMDIKLFVKMESKAATPDLMMHCCNGKVTSKEVHAKKHVFMKNNVAYYYNGDLNKLNKCKVALKEGKWIELLSYNNGETKRKKRNKNFNRKGERVRRTQF